MPISVGSLHFAHELPVGVVFFGAKWSEPTLIGIAYGVERKAQAFRRPTYLKTLPVR